MAPPADPAATAFDVLVSRHGGSVEAAFMVTVEACIRRFAAQNALAAFPAELLSACARGLWRAVNAAGWPQPLAENEAGEPGDYPAARIGEFGAKIFAGLDHRDRHVELEPVVTQLLKACVYPEFRHCRDSYRQVVEGACRRQELERTRRRVSGAHCVDCPHWTALPSEEHLRMLRAAWVAEDGGELDRHRSIFLPEDFRALRILVRGCSRSASLP